MFMSDCRNYRVEIVSERIPSTLFRVLLQLTIITIVIIMMRGTRKFGRAPEGAFPLGSYYVHSSPALSIEPEGKSKTTITISNV